MVFAPRKSVDYLDCKTEDRLPLGSVQNSTLMALVAQVVVGVRPETGKTKGPLLVLARKISSP